MAYETGDYCSLNDIKYNVGIVDSAGAVIDPSKDDGLLYDLIHQSSREIDSFCCRRFYGISETRYYDALDNVDQNVLLLDEDLAAIGTVTLSDGTALSASDYTLLPYNTTPKHQIRLLASSAKWYSYTTDPENAVTVSGTWGYVAGTIPPQVIKEACINLVRWRYQQRHAPFEQTGAGDLATYNVTSGIPQDVQRMLGPYRRYKFGAVEGRY